MEAEDFVSCWKVVQPQVLRVLGYYTSPLGSDVVQDLMQEVAYVAWKNRSSFSGIEGFRGWVLKCARWRAFDALRAQKIFIGLDEETGWATAGREDLGAVRAILEAVKKLPPRQAKVIQGMLRGKSDEQLARELNVNESTIRSLRRFGRVKLRSLLKEGDNL